MDFEEIFKAISYFLWTTYILIFLPLTVTIMKNSKKLSNELGVVEYPEDEVVKNRFGEVQIKLTASKQYKIGIKISIAITLINIVCYIISIIYKNPSDFAGVIVSSGIIQGIILRNIFEIREKGMVIQGFIINWDDIQGAKQNDAELPNYNNRLIIFTFKKKSSFYWKK